MVRALALVFAVAVPCSSLANTPDDCNAPGVRCVTVLPVTNYMRQSLWEPTPKYQDIVPIVEDYLTTRLQVEPQLRLVTGTRIVERLQRLHGGKLREAQRLHREGQRYYDRGDLRRAIRSFEKSLKTYRECYYDVLVDLCTST